MFLHSITVLIGGCSPLFAVFAGATHLTAAWMLGVPGILESRVISRHKEQSCLDHFGYMWQHCESISGSFAFKGDTLEPESYLICYLTIGRRLLEVFRVLPGNTQPVLQVGWFPFRPTNAALLKPTGLESQRYHPNCPWFWGYAVLGIEFGIINK